MKRSYSMIPALMLIAACLGMGSCAGEHESDERATVTVFAAASLTDVMGELVETFEAEAGHRVRLNIASSSALARQIENGASFDIFISANPNWMEYLIDRKYVRSEDVESLLENRLVLVVPESSAQEAVTADDPAPPFERMAIGDPAHVPAGMYAREALESLGWWEDLETGVIPTVDVRAALRLVEHDEVDAGIVYASDVHASDRVRTILTFPESSHARIEYPMAMAPDAGEPARQFARLLRSADAEHQFTKRGFRFMP